jgi:hypothetical protein
MLAAGANCEKKLEWEFFRNLTPAGRSIHLHAGAAFAGGLESARISYYFEGKPAPESLGRGLHKLIELYGDADAGETNKSLDRMLGALEYYFQVWPLGSDRLKPIARGDIPHVEFSFAVPIPKVLHPTTNQPIILAGRTDMIAAMPNGSLFIEDDKTASQLGAQWARQWEMRSQFSCYVWAAQQYGYNVHSVIVRGVSILKTKYDHAEIITDRAEWKVSQWHAQMIRRLNQYKDAWMRGFFDQNLSDACASYGSCPFVKLCDTPEPANWISGNYVTRVWEPLKAIV